MTSLGVRSAFCGVLVCLLGAVASCTHQSAASAAAAKKHAKPKPEESFEIIMETFRRRMEETPVGLVVNNPNGRTTLTGTNKVSSELHPPKTADDPYKATITVKSQSRYSVKVQTETPDEATREKGSKNDRLLPDKEQKGNEAFDSNVAKGSSDNSKTAGSGTHVSEQVLPPLKDEEVHNYDLVYQDGRWILVTELNKETEQAVQNAFKSALETQI